MFGALLPKISTHRLLGVTLWRRSIFTKSHHNEKVPSLISRAKSSEMRGAVNRKMLYTGVIRQFVVYSALYSGDCSQNKDKTQPSNNIADTRVNDKASNKNVEAIYTIPNALTVTRMLMTPVLGYMVLQHAYPWACAIFVFAGLSDLLDGWIARYVPGQSSSLGSFLDPLADKMLICTLFATLTMVDLIPVPLTALVVLRDVILISMAVYLRYRSLSANSKRLTLTNFFDPSTVTTQIKPTLISKMNTGLQLSLVSLTLAAPVFGYVDSSFLQFLWYTTAVTTFTSGIGYIFTKDAFHVKKQPKR